MKSFFQVFFPILCLLTFCALSTLSKKHKPNPQPTDNCGHSYNATNGTIRAHDKTDTIPNKVCNFYVSYNNSDELHDESHKIFLVFEEFLLGAQDTVTIFADEKPLKFFDGLTLANVSGSFALLTGRSNITITVDTTKTPDFAFTKIFRVHYYSNSECAHTFVAAKSGIFHSPLYDHEDSEFPIECSFKFAVPDKDNHYMNLWFDPFIFNKGEILVNGALANNKKYDCTPPVEFLVKDTLEVNVTIFNQTSAPQIFIVKYDSVTKATPKDDNGCSAVIPVSDTRGVTLKSPDRDSLHHLLSGQDKNLNCLWLVDAGVGNTITLTVSGQPVFSQEMDSFLVLDGPNRTSNVLLDLIYERKVNDRVLYSSGQYLWVSVSSPFVTEDFHVEFTVSLTKAGGHFSKNGNLTVNEEDATFLLDVETGKQVKFVPDLSTTRLAQGSFVKFYKDFTKQADPFMTLDSGHQADVIVSPTEKMAIVASGFDKSSLKGSFDGIDEGCYKYGEGSGDTFSVKGHCNSTCAWIVQPLLSSNDLLAFHFQTMSLIQNDLVLIRKMDTTQTLVANVSFPKSHFPDLWLPAHTGVFLQVIRSSCPSESTIIQSSYQITSGCGTSHTPGMNEVVEISSPGYPSHYPLGANCSWTVLKPANAVFLHVSFKDLQLAQENHIVEIFSGTGAKITPIFTSNSTVKELPDDIPVFDSLSVTFTTSTQAPQESLPGFRLEVSVVGRGGVLTGSTGKVETPSFPLNVSDNLLSVWFVTANSTDEKQILQYQFDNRTDLAAAEGLLRIHDGASLRSPLSSNFTNDTVLSRTNSLLLVYQQTKPTSQPGFSLTYSSHKCNMSMICDNGICMHDDWFCNGINECGDYSDERDCEGGGWTPEPPTPTPSPKENVSGASAGVLSGSIIGGFLVGALVGAAIPIGVRYWRTKQLFTYSPVNS